MKRENMFNKSCERARNICIVKTLAKLGHFPTKISEKEAWFLSPLRSETQASFNVSLVKNVWYDFGMGKGGSVIDLIMEMKFYSVKEALDFLEMSPVLPCLTMPKKLSRPETKIEVITVEFLKHPALLKYVYTRKIPVKIAATYCKEVWYRYKNRDFFAIGLENHLGGWELRNKYYKNSSSPKSYSFIDHSSTRLLITEGIFDFLSLAVLKKELVVNTDCIILNSLAFLRDLDDLFPTYSEVIIFLDNDPAGRKATKELLTIYDHITDASDLYSNFKDSNEKLMSDVEKKS